MGNRLVEGFANRKWINIFINAPTPISDEKRIFSDVDMLPTILSSLSFDIDGDRLGFGTDLFSNRKTLVEEIGLDSLNKKFDKMVYESDLLKKKLKEK